MVGISDGNPCTFSSSKNRFVYNIPRPLVGDYPSPPNHRSLTQELTSCDSQLTILDL
jgi:hypothetical protein